MSFKSNIYYFLAFSILLGCSGLSVKEDRFNEYMRGVFDASLADGLYIIIPRDACKGCKDVVFNFLWHSANDGKVNLIFVGKVEEAQYKNYLARIDSKGIKVYKDLLKQIYEYNIVENQFPSEFIKFLEIDNGQVIKQTNLKSEDIGTKHFLNNFFGNHLKQ